MDNLVYCCHACNEYKGDFWQPDSPRRVLHPLREEWAQHIAESDDGRVVGLTESGLFHIELLQLNRFALIANRQRRRREIADALFRQQVLERLAVSEQRIGALEQSSQALKELQDDEF